MKFLTALKYKMRVYRSMAAWYLAIYPLTMIVVSVALIQTSVINENDGSLIYRLSGSVIFLFAVFIRFKEDFDFLLTLSMTRRDIYLAKLATAFGFSLLFSGLIVLERLIVDYLNEIFGYSHFNDPFHFFAPYATENHPAQFVYFLMLCLCCSFGGLLLGSLFYRFGKKFTLVFWLLFSAAPTIVLPMFLWALHQRGELKESMSALGTYLNTFDVPGASGSLLILAVVFCAAAWVNIRRLQQN